VDIQIEVRRIVGRLTADDRKQKFKKNQRRAERKGEMIAVIEQIYAFVVNPDRISFVSKGAE